MAIRPGLMSSEPGVNAAQATAEGFMNEPEVTPEMAQAIQPPPTLPMPPEVIPQEAQPVEGQRPQTHADELSDLFEVPQEDDPDIYSDDLVELDDEDIMGGSDDMSDLISVSREDVMGRPLKKRRVRKPTPPPSMGGMQI